MMNLRSIACTAAAVTLMTANAFAQYSAPSTYYTSANGLTGSALKSALHNIIDGHTKLSYSAVWTALQTLDENPSSTANIRCIYSNRFLSKSARDGSSSAAVVWNREHSWPKSFGFNTESWPAYTDVHHLYACERNINSTRNNCYFENTTGTAYTVFNVTNQFNYRSGEKWQAWTSVRGDLARSMFYMDVRYNGDTANEPDCSLSTSVPVVGTARMANLTTLKAWASADAVDTRERRRNHLVYTSYQGNRNPFVDSPAWVTSIYGN